MCAEAAKGAFGVIRSQMGEEEGMARGKVVLATVQGDVTDEALRAAVTDAGYTVTDIK